MRIVSLLPSATEIVAALGGADDLVGRSEECDFPAGILSRPIVMRARRAFEGASGEIDRRVQAARGGGESLYVLEEETLLALRPDVLLTQDLCGVCSVTEDEVTSACRRRGVATRIVSVSPTRLAEVAASFAIVGEAIDRREPGVRLRREFEERVGVGASGSAGAPTVAVLEWVDPPILAGLWAPEMIAAAGGRPIEVHAGAPGVRTTWEALRAAQPDLVVVAPCSFTVRHTLGELAASPRLTAALRSIDPRYGTIVADEAFFSRPGPRLADGVDLLRRLLAQGSPGDGATRWAPTTPRSAEAAA